MRAALPASALLFLVTSCGNASPPAEPSAPAAAPSASVAPAAPKDDSAAKAAAVEALTSGEAKSGTCDPGHQAALDKLLADVEKNATGMTTVGKRVVALGAGAKAIEMSVSGKGTEVHVLAFGAKDVSLDVLVGTAAATTMRSPLQHAVPLALDLPKIGNYTDVQSDSRQIQIKPGAPLTIKLSGQGCAGLVTLVKQ